MVVVSKKLKLIPHSNGYDETMTLCLRQPDTRRRGRPRPFHGSLGLNGSASRHKLPRCAVPCSHPDSLTNNEFEEDELSSDDLFDRWRRWRDGDI